METAIPLSQLLCSASYYQQISCNMTLNLSPLRMQINCFLIKQSTTSTPFRRYSSGSHLPRIAQPGLWHSIVPKFLRRSPDTASKPPLERSKGFRKWINHPSTHVIVL